MRKSKKYEIPEEYFRSRLCYDTEVGKLFWLNGACKDRFVGTTVENRAGNKYQYFTLGYKGKSYNFMEHVVVWFLAYSDWPPEIDHIDGNGLNNKLENLRSVTRSQNNRNHRLQKNNKITKIAGVRFYNKKTPLWQAYSYDSVNRKQIQLGNYDNFFDACCARKSFEAKNGFTDRHGK